MTAIPLAADTIIEDGKLYCWDWDGSPRFYLARIFAHDSGRVNLRVELEGDPKAYSHDFCDNNDSAINESMYACIGEIEVLCAAQWDREQEAERRDCLTDYERQFGF